MWYRVIFDYGDVETMIMVETTKVDAMEIAEVAIDGLTKRGLILPPEENITCVAAAPEWGED
ncbi:hypothetical protein ACWCQ1_51540 [Streptomyces sp. NPDC002144]|jgi:hypothetical protein|uniref:hypothetical protein n=1 Tax=Bacilli TaxID=91061 RepID=UPI002041D7C1|nr:MULTISPECIES: hypothetical protein [Bacilli]MCM3032891.1 hypothetical protein [Niallia sp. MER 6]MDK8746893.1 hypothetical protein [Streptococcus agalactiae]